MVQVFARNLDRDRFTPANPQQVILCSGRNIHGCSFGLSALQSLSYMQHAALGQLLLGITICTFCYITLWLLVTVSSYQNPYIKSPQRTCTVPDTPCCFCVLLQPFIDSDQPVLRLFPATSLLYLPLGLFITTFIAAVLGFVGWLMFSEPAASAITTSS